MSEILPEDEAAEEAARIFMRLFDALARRMGKRLSAGSREDIRRACALLVNAGEELDTLFEDAPPLPDRPPPARNYQTMPLEVEEWRQRKGRPT